MSYQSSRQDVYAEKPRRPGRPRGGKSPEEVRQYWREQKQKGDKTEASTDARAL